MNQIDRRIERLSRDLPEWVLELVHGSLAREAEGHADSRTWLRSFLRVEKEMIVDRLTRLDNYRKYATKKRKEYELRPFSWDMETEDRVKQCFIKVKGGQKYPRTPKQRVSNVNYHLDFKERMRVKPKQEFANGEHLVNSVAPREPFPEGEREGLDSIYEDVSRKWNREFGISRKFADR
jgi:hypothetical protein